MVEELANPERLVNGNIDFSFIVIFLLPILSHSGEKRIIVSIKPSEGMETLQIIPGSHGIKCCTKYLVNWSKAKTTPAP